MLLEKEQIRLKLIALQDQDAKNNLRIEEQRKNYVYYSGDKSEIKEYLIKALKRTWSIETVNKMILSYIMLTQKVVKGLANVYNESPRRKILKGENEDKDFTEYYNSLLPSDTATIDKEVHRLTKLLSTTLPMLRFNTKTFRFEESINSTHLYDVLCLVDTKKADAISYDKYYDIKGENQVLKVVYTDNLFFGINSNNEIIPIPTNYANGVLPDKENPELDFVNRYGIKPFIELHANKSSLDYWGNGLSMLVEENETINIIATKLNLEDIVYGTTGILHGINLGNLTGANAKEENNPEKTPTTEKQVLFGREALLLTESKMGQTVPPSISYIGTDPHIEEIINAIEFKVKLTASMNGLNPNAFSVKSYPESGIAKLIDSASEILERVDDIELCRDYEQQRFNIIKTMNNSIIKNKLIGYEKLKEIPENLILTIDFQEPKLQLSITDLWNNRKNKVEMNLITPVDILMEENPDIKSKDFALSTIVENKIINDNNQANANTIISTGLVI